MNTLIIAVERKGEVHIFFSQQLAEAFLEPVDIKNNEYEIYAGDGTVIEAAAEAGGLLRPDVVSLKASDRNESERLRTLLLSYLRRLGLSVQDDVPLEKVVQLASQHADSSP